MTFKVLEAEEIPEFRPRPALNRDQALERMDHRLSWLRRQPFGRGVIFLDLDDEIGRALGADGLILWCARHGLSLHQMPRSRMFALTREPLH